MHGCFELSSNHSSIPLSKLVNFLNSKRHSNVPRNMRNQHHHKRCHDNGHNPQRCDHHKRYIRVYKVRSHHTADNQPHGTSFSCPFLFAHFRGILLPPVGPRGLRLHPLRNIGKTFIVLFGETDGNTYRRKVIIVHAITK